MISASESSVVRRDGDAGIGGGVAAPGAASWLALAAMPTFAVMALWTGLSGVEPEMFCLRSASPLGSMTLMYGLMSAFHAAPWLGLIRRDQSRRVSSQRLR